MELIPLSQGKFAIVDADLAPILSKLKWHAALTGKFYARTYELRKENRTMTMMHHLVVGFPLKGLMVDHINGDGLDNRRENLRIVTCRDNVCNRVIEGKTSKYPGVHWHKKNRKWRSQIKFGDKRMEVGSFDSESEAWSAYLKAANKFGEEVHLVHR